MADVFAIIHAGALPAIIFRDYLYIIDISGQSRGMFYYTKFTKNGQEAIHSVNTPYTNGLTLGETLDHSEGLRDKLAPVITEIPPLVYTIL